MTGAATMPRHSHPLLSSGALLLAMFSFTGGASVAKTLFPAIGAEGATWLRLALGAALLSALLRPWRLNLTPPQKRALIVYGAVLGLMNLSFYMAIKTIPLGIAIAIELTGPLAVAMIASRRRIDWLWIVLAIAGLAMLLPLRGLTNALDPRGMLFALGAGICWAIYIVAGKRAGAEHGAQVTALGLAIGAVAILPIGLPHLSVAALAQPKIAGAAFLVAILSSALPYSLEMFALRRLPAEAYGTIVSAEPAVGAMVGFVLLGEVLTPLQWLAIGTIVLASLGTTLTHKTASPPA